MSTTRHDRRDPPASGLAGYQHTQRGPLCLLLYLVAAHFLLIAWLLRNEVVVPWIVALSSLLIALLGASMHHLSVVDRGDHLLVHFGPLPLFRRRISYEEIIGVEVGRTTLLDGWGIHYSLRGGWVWNLWGRDCVILLLRDRLLRVGTDDAAALTQFLRTKMSNNQARGREMHPGSPAPWIIAPRFLAR